LVFYSSAINSKLVFHFDPILEVEPGDISHWQVATFKCLLLASKKKNPFSSSRWRTNGRFYDPCTSKDNDGACSAEICSTSFPHPHTHTSTPLRYRQL